MTKIIHKNYSDKFCRTCVPKQNFFVNEIKGNLRYMASYSIGEALNLLLEKSHWKPKVNELRLKQEWEAIVGKTICKYTRSLLLVDKRLTVYTDVAPLKQELLLGKEQLANNINEYFGERVVEEIVIK